MADVSIGRVVEAVSDGEQVDWAALQQRSNDPTVRASCAHLETLSKIAASTAESNRVEPEAREPTWTAVLLFVALLHIVLGLVGSVLFRPYSLVNALRVLSVLSFAGMGIVLRSRRDNPRARDLGAVFLLVALGFSRQPYVAFFDAVLAPASWPAVLRSGLVVDAWAPFFFWQFARRFPASTRFTRTDRLATAFGRVAAAIGTVLFLVNLWAIVAHPTAGLARTFALTFEEGQRFSAVIFGLTLPALVVMVLRAREAGADERARVRVFAWAMAAGIAPSYIEVILEALFPAYTAFLRASPTALTAMVCAVLVPLLGIPLVTGYSVLVHRLLDVKVVVGASVRYLMTKWSLILLTLTPFGFLVSYVYARRSESVAEVVGAPRSLTLLALVGAGCGLLAGKNYVLGVFNEWFDRRGGDRTGVLAECGTALRLVRARSELADCVSEAAGRAFRAPATVYLFDPRRHAYVSTDRRGLSLSGDSALVTMMMQEPSLAVLTIAGKRSLARFLPQTERLWLAEADAEVVSPIRAIGLERPAGLIAFGPRGDAGGYSGDDKRFVAALASAAGIALENLRLKADALGEDADEFGMLCVRCYRVIDFVEGQGVCPCGGALQVAAVPRRVNRKFLVEGLLGSGGMGVAYLATDLDLKRPVAIKTLPSISPDAMATLAREAQMMASLSHPNLATILGCEWWRGTPLLICEYLPGGTLQQRFARGPLPVGEAVALGLELLQALEYMHDQGVLHRDIKPSNIAFTRDKTPKLLDFGLAGLMERAQLSPGAWRAPLVTTRLAGTIAYMPPQAFAGALPSAHFDLWALAVVLFEAVAGRHPFADGPATEANIRRGRFVARLDDAAVPPDVAAFLRRTLNVGAAPAFDSAATMRDALAATLSALPATERSSHAH